MQDAPPSTGWLFPAESSRLATLRFAKRRTETRWVTLEVADRRSGWVRLGCRSRPNATAHGRTGVRSRYPATGVRDGPQLVVRIRSHDYPFPTKVLSDASSWLMALFASAKSMAVLGLVYSSLSMPA